VLNHLCCAIGQAKFTKYSKLKEAGRSFNEDLRNSKGYRNPDFLQHAVTHENIDQIGSCFRPDIFNPHGYEEIDFFDALGVTVIATHGLGEASQTTINTTTSAVTHTATTTTEVSVKNEFHASKKSKWDKATNH
jgi:hypothetical protein